MQPLPKKRFPYGIKRFFPASLLSSLLGTYLDLFFVGNHLYYFPIRPFPSIYTINIFFTLIFLPLFTFIFLYLIEGFKKQGRAVLILFFSLGMTLLEKVSEDIGLFIHSDVWSHLYTFIGNGVFLNIIVYFHQRFNRINDSQDF